MTRRLFHEDAYRRSCEAVVTAVEGSAVALSETVFYPTSGGQPHDLGRLDGGAVVDVRDEANEIWHVLDAAAPTPALGARMTGELDWDRRFDHMQQHTGQHILSQAFLQSLAAQTASVHMGASCTLDLAISTVSGEEVARAEDLANSIVMENRQVTTREVDPGEIEALGLRRPPKQTGRIRVVEVIGFDRSACGGTHVATSGEVGPIAIRGWERNKGGVRVEFLCGWRALRDYRWTHGLVRGLAGQFTVGERDLMQTIAHVRERARDLDRELADARTRLLDYEAAELIAAQGTASSGDAGVGRPRVIAASFAGRPIEELRTFARLLTARTDCVAIVTTEPDRRLVVFRSPAVNVDAGAIIRETLAAFGGRGGGKPEAAEGMAAAAPSASALVEAARVVAGRHLAASYAGTP